MPKKVIPDAKSHGGEFVKIAFKVPNLFSNRKNLFQWRRWTGRLVQIITGASPSAFCGIGISLRKLQPLHLCLSTEFFIQPDKSSTAKMT